MGVGLWVASVMARVKKVSASRLVYAQVWVNTEWSDGEMEKQPDSGGITE